jgi:hypothetical protein
MTGRQCNAESGSSFIEQCFAPVAEDLHWWDSGAGAAVLSQAFNDMRINLIIVPQMSDEDIRAPSFAVPKHWRLPTVILLGDDMGHADGPRAFHKRSMRVVLENADGIVLVASGSLVEMPAGPPAPLAYTKAVEFASNGRNRQCVLIETLPECEEAWLALIRKHRRKNTHLLFCAVKDAPRGPNAAFFERAATE